MIKKVTRLDWRGWLKGLLAAAIQGVGTALSVITAAQFIRPDQLGYAWEGLTKLAMGTAVISAIIGVGLYLKQSPLPADIEVTIEEKTETNIQVKEVHNE